MSLLKKTILALGFITFAFGATAAEVNIKESKIVWKADKKLGSGHTGEIPILSAKADIGKEGIKSGEFVVDMQKFTVTDLSGEKATKFLGHVRSGDFFEADKYKTATLKIEKQIAPNKVKGTLTIKEISQPIEIEFKKDGKTYSGKFSFDRTKHNINYASGTIFAALSVDKIIKDEVEVDFKIALK